MSAGLSLVIPVHNGGLYIREALESALHQSCPPDEILVVDDASTDNTVEIVKNLGAGIQVLEIAKAGADAARNEGVRRSRFDLIAFMDADDYMTKERLFLQKRFLERESGLDLVFGHLEEFEGDRLPVQGVLDAERIRKPGVCAGTLTVRKSAFLKIGFFDTCWATAGFMDWYFRVLDGGYQNKMLEETVLYRRIHGGNLTLRESALMSREYAQVIAGRLRRKSRGV